MIIPVARLFQGTEDPQGVFLVEKKEKRKREKTTNLKANDSGL